MRSLLALAYYFPPSGGPGVQRTLRFVRDLPGLGWMPTVISVRPGDAAWPSIDAALEAAIPPAVEVRRTAAFDLYAGYARLTGRRRNEAVSVGFADAGEPGVRERLARWIRGNVFLPDARIGWVPYARAEALRLVRTRVFDAIWSTGPPHSTHLAARSVARETGLPWVVDVRDAWPDPTYGHRLGTGRLARRFDESLRSGVYDEASAIVAIGDHMADALRRITKTPVHVIPNGYEEGQFEGLEPTAHAGFELLYTGNMPTERNPEALWRALARLGDRAPHLRIRLVGTIDASVRRAVESAGVAHRVRFDEPVLHADALNAMVSADALLLVVNRTVGAEGILTGKVFEYVASGRVVLGLGPVGGEADGVLRQAGSGGMIDWDDVDGVSGRLLSLYDAWAAGRPVTGATPGAARTFSGAARSHELAALLDDLVSASARGSSPSDSSS